MVLNPFYNLLKIGVTNPLPTLFRFSYLPMEPIEKPSSPARPADIQFYREGD